MIKFDLDPTPLRVCLIAVCLFLLTFLGGLVVILQTEVMPTPVQWLTLGVIAGIELVTYILTFLQKEEVT